MTTLQGIEIQGMTSFLGKTSLSATSGLVSDQYRVFHGRLGMSPIPLYSDTSNPPELRGVGGGSGKDGCPVGTRCDLALPL